jgi:hypothetical protein
MMRNRGARQDACLLFSGLLQLVGILGREVVLPAPRNYSITTCECRSWTMRCQRATNGSEHGDDYEEAGRKRARRSSSARTRGQRCGRADVKFSRHKHTLLPFSHLRIQLTATFALVCSHGFLPGKAVNLSNAPLFWSLSISSILPTS